MGILISNAALTTTIVSARNSELPATLSATYAATRANQPGMTYLENARELVALLQARGWPLGRDLRIQWAPSPAVPAAVMTEVRTAIEKMPGNLAGVNVHSSPNTNSSLGAQAYSSGNTPAFGTDSTNHGMGHEATHVVQQRGGTGNN